MKKLFVIWALGAGVLCSKGLSYPAYISYGYASCRTCHFNPLGNGPISSYGRAVQATEISGNLFGAEPEALANHSGFILGPLPEWLQLQLGYRGLYLTQGLQAQPRSRWIHMQAEGAAAVSFGKKLVVVASAGYAPLPESLSPSEKARLGTLISREHYLGITPQKGLGFYIGLMDVAFGLRIPDHNAYIRSAQFLNINDQTHGILFHNDWEQGELGLHVFLGKFQQDSQARLKGASFFSEISLGENSRGGFSALASQSEYRSRQMIATHGRFQMGKGSSLLAEVGLFRQTQAGIDSYQVGSFSLLQSRHQLMKGLFALTTFEHYVENLKEGSPRLFRAGPSLEVLPFSKVELRVDFLGTQSMGLPSSSPSSYLIQVQTHVWI